MTTMVCVGGKLDGTHANIRGGRVGDAVRLEERRSPVLEPGDAIQTATFTQHAYRIEQINLRDAKGNDRSLRFLAHHDIDLEEALRRVLTAYGERDD